MLNPESIITRMDIITNNRGKHKINLLELYFFWLILRYEIKCWKPKTKALSNYKRVK